MNPIHDHDCDICQYLGIVEKVDIYWCAASDMPELHNVIMRTGSEGPNYAAIHPPSENAYGLEWLEHMRSRSEVSMTSRCYLWGLAEAARHGLYKGSIADKILEET